MDTKGIYDKYDPVTRKDGKPVGRVLVIEIDKDPQASDIVRAVAEVVAETRPAWAGDLRMMTIPWPGKNPDTAPAHLKVLQGWAEDDLDELMKEQFSGPPKHLARETKEIILSEYLALKDRASS